MQENFTKWLAFAWRPENDGQGYHFDKSDPGGNTNRGVIQTTWDDAVRKGYVEGDLKTAYTQDLTIILRKDCWDACSCSALVGGTDVMVADMAMVAGSGTAARCLQRVIGTYDDGVIGPLTLGKLTNYLYHNQPPILDALLTADETYYASLRQFRLWGNGWTRRAKDCRDFAASLIMPT